MNLELWGGPVKGCAYWTARAMPLIDVGLSSYGSATAAFTDAALTMEDGVSAPSDAMETPCHVMLVMVGLLPTGMQPVPISLAITRELELKGSFRFNDEIDDVIAALADGSLHIEPVITHEFPLADALHAFEVAKDSTSSGKVLLSFCGEGPDQ